LALFLEHAWADTLEDVWGTQRRTLNSQPNPQIWETAVKISQANNLDHTHLIAIISGPS
jgi:hypothetical protein